MTDPQLKQRVFAVDLLRGIVMMVMPLTAFDETRYFLLAVTINAKTAFPDEKLKKTFPSIRQTIK